MPSLMASDPEYAEINEHQMMLCIYHNGHVRSFGWSNETLDELPWLERGTLLRDVTTALQELLDGVPPRFLREHFDEEWE